MRLLGLPNQVLQVSDGPQGTWQTLQVMKGIVNDYKKDIYIRLLAAQIVQQVAPKDWMGEISALFEFVRNNIRYLQDVDDIETLQTPLATLQLKHGDCDDMCILLCSLAGAIGYPTKFTAIGFYPDVFEHVYAEIYLLDTNQWIAADPTEPNELGWSATGFCSKMSL